MQLSLEAVQASADVRAVLLMSSLALSMTFPLHTFRQAAAPVIRTHFQLPIAISCSGPNSRDAVGCGLLLRVCGDACTGVAREGVQGIFHDDLKMPAGDVIDGYLKPMKVAAAVVQSGASHVNPPRY